jgi:hypothetical protein
VLVEKIESRWDVHQKFALRTPGKRPIHETNEKEESVQVENFPVCMIK